MSAGSATFFKLPHKKYFRFVEHIMELPLLLGTCNTGIKVVCLDNLFLHFLPLSGGPCLTQTRFFQLQDPPLDPRDHPLQGDIKYGHKRILGHQKRNQIKPLETPKKEKMRFSDHTSCPTRGVFATDRVSCPPRCVPHLRGHFNVLQPLGQN